MTVDTTRFCGSCGAARESMTLRFCRQCGAAFAPTGAVSVVPSVAPSAPAPFVVASLGEARRRPRLIVTLLGLLGNATYAFFWLWMSWRELKRIRGDASMSPFWHAVAIFVMPLYGLFRFHAHFRTIDELNAAARVPVRAGAGLLTLVFFLVLGVLYGGLLLSAAAASSGRAAFSLQPLSLVVVGAAYAYIVGTGQRALSAYFSSLSGVTIPERGHALEYVFIVLFFLSFSAQVFIAFGGTLG
ncbi:MAG: hypothetical protein HYU87_11810 [Chloroflexi bacterium]|nr:hypothetical protein [Chloroflexota bacterium]